MPISAPSLYIINKNSTRTPVSGQTRGKAPPSGNSPGRFLFQYTSVYDKEVTLRNQEGGLRNDLGEAFPQTHVCMYVCRRLRCPRGRKTQLQSQWHSSEGGGGGGGVLRFHTCESVRRWLSVRGNARRAGHLLRLSTCVCWWATYVGHVGHFKLLERGPYFAGRFTGHIQTRGSGRVT